MIQLIKPTYIRGALADAGTSHNLGTGQEAALVHAGIAAYVVAPSNEPDLVARYRLDSARKIIALQDPDGDDYRGWDDLRFPAQAINPTGPEVAPTVATSGILGTLLFPTNATAVIAGIAQMPHAWARGTPVRPHIHWAKTSSASGGVVWQFRYAVASFGKALPDYRHGKAPRPPSRTSTPPSCTSSRPGPTSA